MRKRLIAIFTIGLTLLAFADEKNGLVGYWKFNEGTGDKLTDLSGNGNIYSIKLFNKALNPADIFQKTQKAMKKKRNRSKNDIYFYDFEKMTPEKLLKKLSGSFDTRRLKEECVFLEQKWDKRGQFQDGTLYAAGNWGLPNGWTIDNYNNSRTIIANEILALKTRLNREEYNYEK